MSTERPLPIPTVSYEEDANGQWLTLRVGSVEHRMRWIDPGSFLLGSPETDRERLQGEWPQHEVTLTRGYWLGETPVTQELYAAVVGENPSQFRGGKRPVETVSWDDCLAFVGRLNELLPDLDARLPTEAEWEKACRAGSDASRFGPISEVAWSRGNSEEQTHDVGSKQANAWGLHDTLGNVWEWCADGWQRDTRNRSGLSAVDPRVPRNDDFRVYRGGSWCNDTRVVRAASRRGSLRSFRNNYVGFRFACDLTASKNAGRVRKEAGAQLDGGNVDTLGDRISGQVDRSRKPTNTQTTSTVKLEFLCLREDRFTFGFEGEEHYRRPEMGAGRFTFDWSREFLCKLHDLYDGQNAGDAREIGRTVASFLKRAGYKVPAENTHVEFCAEATELYALPLELARTESGRWLGLTPGSSITYRWPNTFAAKQRGGENGRILLMWSDVASAVPHDKHMTVLSEVLGQFRHRWLRFDPGRDVLARPSLSALNKKLCEADASDQPIRVLHVLCHGSPLPLNRGYGLALAPNGEVIGPDAFANVVADYASMVRLVVLCVCHGGDTTLGLRVGSVAQALHNANVANVVASRFPLRVSDSVALTRTLYAGLAGGLSNIGTALTAARQESHRLHSSTCEWATLQFYAAPPPEKPASLVDNKARLKASLGRTRKTDPEYAKRLKDHRDDPSFIGSYLKLEQLGRGGFGIVWLAADLDDDRLVALKIMPPADAVERSRRDRFDRGARMMEKYQHPHIVKILERGGEHDDRSYFVMEFIDGGDLGHIKTKPTHEQVVRVIEQVGSALTFAHEHGLVHRDIKPNNILLDRCGNAYLADFDLVRAEDEETGNTRTAALGTFLYAAPEQQLSAKDATPTVDVYSLGMTAVYMFNGAKLSTQVLRHPDRVINNLPVEPSVRKVLAKAIEWEDEERYGTVSEFVEALRFAMTPRKASGCGEPGMRPIQGAVAPKEIVEPCDALQDPRPGWRPDWAVPAIAPAVVVRATSFETGGDIYGTWLRFEVGDVEHRMRWIPAGEFVMGSPEDEEGRTNSEGPPHSVALTRGFWLGETPCTQGLWRAVLGSNPSKFAGDTERPVERVSWQGAIELIEALNRRVRGLNARLPTEAEWEYACRGGCRTARYGLLHEIAWYSENSNGCTQPVGKKLANPWGVHDMLGNVWEWCSDGRRMYSSGHHTDPVVTTWDQVRMRRGGSWFRKEKFQRAAFRHWAAVDYCTSSQGFRLSSDGP